MKLTKMQIELFNHIAQNEDTIREHFHEWYTWREVCTIFNLKYSTDTRTRTKQQKAIMLFTNFVNNCESGKALRFTIKGFTELYNNKKQGKEQITKKEFEIAFSQLDDTTLRKRYAKNLLVHLFLTIVSNANNEEQRKRYINNSDITQWYVSKSDLCKAIGMTSDSENFAIRDIGGLCKALNIDKQHYDIVDDHIKVEKHWKKTTLDSTLNYLSDTLNVITYTDKAYKVEMLSTELDSYGRAITTTKTTYTTLDEIEWINLVAIPKCLQDHSTEKQQLNTVADLYKYNLVDDFYKHWLIDTINKNVPKWYGWGTIVSVTKCYRIGFNFEIVDLAIHKNVDLGITQDEINELAHLKDINVSETITQTRTETVDKRNENTVERHEKALQIEEQQRSYTEQVRAKYEYVEVGYMVNTELHNSKTKYRNYYSKPKDDIQVARMVE